MQRLFGVDGMGVAVRLIQALSVPSADNLDFIMESLALGHTVLDQRQVSRACHLCSPVLQKGKR